MPRGGHHRLGGGFDTLDSFRVSFAIKNRGPRSGPSRRSPKSPPTTYNQAGRTRGGGATARRRAVTLKFLHFYTEWWAGEGA